MIGRPVSFLRALSSDRSGSPAVEFGLLAPLFAILAVGVFQGGFYVQKYNALRNLSGDVARYAMIEYQKGNDPTATTIQNHVQTLANNGGFELEAARLTPSVSEVTNTSLKQISHAREMTITLTYTPPDLLTWVDGTGLTLSYTRPVFLIDNS